MVDDALSARYEGLSATNCSTLRQQPCLNTCQLEQQAERRGLALEMVLSEEPWPCRFLQDGHRTPHEMYFFIASRFGQLPQTAAETECRLPEVSTLPFRGLLSLSLSLPHSL